MFSYSWYSEKSLNYEYSELILLYIHVISLHKWNLRLQFKILAGQGIEHEYDFDRKRDF